MDIALKDQESHLRLKFEFHSEGDARVAIVNEESDVAAVLLDSEELDILRRIVHGHVKGCEPPKAEKGARKKYNQLKKRLEIARQDRDSLQKLWSQERDNNRILEGKVRNLQAVVEKLGGDINKLKP